MAELYCDHYFHSGILHTVNGKPCQDYAISGCFEDGSVFGIVSDGCSSGKNTDVGSRLISLATASAIREYRKTTFEIAVKEINFRRMVTTSGIRRLLGLGLEDLLATCLYAYLTPKGGFVHVSGDGAVAFLDRKGDINMSCFEWNKNIPFYPAYAEDNCLSFADAHGGNLSAPVLLREDWRFSSEENQCTISDATYYSIEEGIKGILFPISAEALNNLAYVAVFTDGVKQIDGIEWKSAVKELLSFKSLYGDFAKRRMIRFIKNSREKGRGPIDDIAYSVIRISDGGKE